MMYAVVATRKTERVGGWTGSVQIPIFFLSSDVQGIVSLEHAERIAREVLGEGCHITVLAAPEPEGAAS